MSKSKDRSEVENLRGIVKGLKSEVRNLKKQLSRYTKRAQQYEDLENKIQDIELEDGIEVVISSQNKCAKCKGKLVEANLGVRTLIRCEDCGHRETKKNE